MLGTMWMTNRLRGLCAALLVISGSASVSAQAGEDHAHDCPSVPALGFVAGSSLHVGYDVDTRSIGSDRISLQPNASPPEDAFVPFEGHPDWGRVAIAVIVSPPDAEPDYLPIYNASSEDASLTVPALRDYFVIYLERSAPAGSEFADYVFHSSQGLSRGYHLVHAEYDSRDDWDEPTYVFTVVDIDQPIPDNFERGVIPTGLNL